MQEVEIDREGTTEEESGDSSRESHRALEGHGMEATEGLSNPVLNPGAVAVMVG